MTYEPARVKFALVLCLLLLPRMAASQGVTTASLAGVVKDASGAVLPGVTIEASSPALIEKVRVTTSDERGEYRIIQLPSGTYAVTFTMPGFGTVKRDGLELVTNFTATVNVELKIGTLEETVTVSGETPIVDVQNVAQQKVLSRTLLDTLPSNKGMFAYAALMPTVLVVSKATDVGGNQGETSLKMSVHGSRMNDQKLLQDGMRVSNLNNNGSGRGYIVNALGVQEMVIDVAAGGSAEYSSGGAQVNTIPKDGGNEFSGSFFTSFMNNSMQASNLTPELQAQGLTSVNSMRLIYDFNGVVGGPIMKDRLWFITAHRRWGRTQRIGNLYHDSNLDDWIYTPDLGRPADVNERDMSHNVRFSWQATAKDKITGLYDYQQYHNQNNGGILSVTTKAKEANDRNAGGYCPDTNLAQATWTRPQSNRVLFEAGATRLTFFQTDFGTFNCDGELDRVAVIEQNVSVAPALWHGVGTRTEADQAYWNGRASMSYVTGAHNFKTGMFFLASIKKLNRTERTPADVRGLPISFTFNTGNPVSLTEFVSPIYTTAAQRPELGLFAQDQWKIRRLTLNLGLRYEYVREVAPAISEPAGPLTDPQSFPEVTCIPCWHDINARAAVVYDLFGNGKTALKVAWGRYSESETLVGASAFAPTTAAVLSTTRAWTDANRDYFPDCGLRNPATNGECGAMANASFGSSQIRTRPDPNWITGWGNRGYNWRGSVSLDQALWPGAAINVGYFRTSFHNQTVSDNQLVTPADYDPYCVTAPTDSRLGSISGSQVCGLYDINPARFGQIDNVVTLASHYGNYIEVYNGADVNFQARLPKGATVSGGLSIGNSVGLNAGLGNIVNPVNRCFVVDSPQQLYHCEDANPYLAQFKMNGSMPLPWDLQVAAVYQNLTGSNYQAQTTYTSAQVATSLGRPLAGGTRTVTVDLLPTNSAFSPRIQDLDVRLSKKLRFGRTRFQLNADAYNVLNASPPLVVTGTYGTSWQKPEVILDARTFKVGVQVDF